MKPKKNGCLAVIFGLLLPWILWNCAGSFLGLYEEPTALPTTGLVPSETGHQSLTITVWMGQAAVEMELEEYLVGVVLGEMPASFEMEALKAQAVVARTYTLRRQMAPKHEEGAVCTDPGCCQAYRDPEAYLRDGGGRESLDRVVTAVEATAGLVLTYEGQLIEATYFASSGGRTEDAQAVWGSDIPYLQATDSPEGPYAQRHDQTLVMTVEEFQEALGMNLSGSPATWVRSVSYTNGGGVAIMNIGGREFTGTELRRLLNLSSTVFVIAGSGDEVTISSRGYGHRVGMSQYGAEAMALEGSSYQTILAHYYQGTVLEEYIDIGRNLG